MAILGVIIGFETGGLEQISSTVGSPVVQTGTVRTGTYSLKLTGATTQELVGTAPFERGVNDTNDHIVGAAFRFTDVTPNSTYDLLRPATDVNFTFQMEATTGDLLLLNAVGTEVASAAAPFTANTWHFVEILIEQANSGKCIVHVDGVEVINVTGQDFLVTLRSSFWEFLGPNTVGEDIFIDDIYRFTNVSGGAGDFLGNAEVFPYQSAHTTATDLGNALDAGTWDDAGQTPLDVSANNTADYTGTPLEGGTQTDDGARTGPSGDPRIDGNSNIKGAEGVYHAKRGGGSGAGDVKEVRLGNSADGMTNKSIGPTSQFKNFYQISEAATVVPLSTEFFQLGMKNEGARDLIMGEMWAMLLHVPTAPALTALSQADFPDQNYYVGPFEI